MNPNELIFPKAKRFEPSKIKRPVLIEEKIDGHRYMIKKGHAYGRNLNKDGVRENRWDKMPDSVKALATDIFIDGELVWPGHESTDVPTGIKNNEPEMDFVGFRLPVWDGLVMPDEHHDIIGQYGIRSPKLFDTGYEDVEDLNVDALKTFAGIKHYEGWVLKERCLEHKWWKLKLEWAYDLVILDYVISTSGRHKGKLKSMTCGLADGTVKANVSGMSDTERYAFNPAKDIGRVIEVKANGIASQGKLRHPRFIRFRPDKSREECTTL